MPLDITDSNALLRLGQAIRKKRETMGITQQALGDLAGYSDKIIRTIERGGRTKRQTLEDVCQATGLSTSSFEIKDNKIADAKYGSYNLSHFMEYIGFYFGIRNGLDNQTDYLRTVYEISWSDSKKCLQFLEDHKYVSDINGRTIDYSQRGDIYISNRIGLLHFLTRTRGAIRLITLTQARLDDGLLEGIVLTQLQSAHYYLPAASPIYLQRVEGVSDRAELAPLIGPVRPTHEDYASIAVCMEEVERDVARFAPLPSRDPKIARISSTRLAKRQM